MRVGLVCLAIVLPALAGCKMALVKGAARLALGAEQAEALDPVAQVRRQVIQSLRQGGAPPALPSESDPSLTPAGARAP